MTVFTRFRPFFVESCHVSCHVNGKKSVKFSEVAGHTLLTVFVFGNHILFQMSPKNLTTNFLPSDCKFQLSKALKL